MPSGLTLTLQEILLEEQYDHSLWARFRYVASGLADTPFDAIQDDFPALCAEQVLPWAGAEGLDLRQVVVSLASEPLEFGVSDPSVTQYFEAFRLEDGACIWEGL